MSGSAESPLRLFFAVMPDEACRERIAVASQSLRLGPEARLVPCNNYHITLAFVGEVAAQQLPVLRRIGAGQRASVLSLRFDAYDYWPKPEVVVAAARTVPPTLQSWWEQLHRDLAVHGWALDAKRLRPHVTLARKVSQAPVLQAMSAFEWCAREFCLMRSDIGGSHSAYTVVDTWPLLDNPEKQ
jgi:RNA 2',3'-cyclic 3'-phosphodiesterase